MTAPASQAAVRAGLSARRRSWRNQKMIGCVIVISFIFIIYLRFLSDEWIPRQGINTGAYYSIFTGLLCYNLRHYFFKLDVGNECIGYWVRWP